MQHDLTIELPPSDNDLRTWIPRGPHRGQVVDTAEYRHWKSRTKNFILHKLLTWTPSPIEHGILRPTELMQLEIPVTINTDNVQQDSSNFIKAAKDILSTVYYDDDRWVNLLVSMPIERVGKNEGTLTYHLSKIKWYLI